MQSVVGSTWHRKGREQSERAWHSKYSAERGAHRKHSGEHSKYSERASHSDHMQGHSTVREHSKYSERAYYSVAHRKYSERVHALEGIE